MQVALGTTFALRPLSTSTAAGQQMHQQEEGSGRKEERRKDSLAVTEEDIGAITDQIPQRPMGVVEGTSYTVVIVAALAFAGTDFLLILLLLSDNATSGEGKRLLVGWITFIFSAWHRHHQKGINHCLCQWQRAICLGRSLPSILMVMIYWTGCEKICARLVQHFLSQRLGSSFCPACKSWFNG